MLKIINFTLLSAAMAFSVQANAELQFGFSVGQSFGEEASRSDLTYPTIVQYSQPERDQVDQKTNSFAFKVFGNYQYETHGRFEFGYLDLGEYTYDGNFAHNGDPSRQLASAVSTIDTKASVDGFYFAYLPTKKINNKSSLFGKIGIFFWDFKGDYSAVTTVNTTSGDTFSYTANEYTLDSLDDSGNDLFLGLGYNYKKFFVELERYKVDVSDATYLGFGARF